MKLTHFALLFVVFLDLMNQGLVIPILTTAFLDPTESFLPAATSMAARQFSFGLTMGVFFLFWFFGAAFISKLSDAIGRKEGILLCLVGNLLGYLLAVLALEAESFWLLLVARAISGFTAGNQPIAQAALIDLSESEAQKTRFLGYVLTALSLGLVVGPLIGGIFSDPDRLGPWASLALPFYIVSGLVVINIILIAAFFHNQRKAIDAARVRLMDIVLALWLAVKRPIIVRIAVVYFCGQTAFYAYFLFMDNYFLLRFDFTTFENSLALAVLGSAMGLAGAFLVDPLNRRFGRRMQIVWGLIVMGASAAVAAVNPWVVMNYVLIVPLVVGFAVFLPQMLTLFSAAVDDSEQGWVMGVSIALFTLGAGLISLLGGWLITIDVRLPFAAAAVGSFLAALLAVTLWRSNDMRALLGGRASR